MAATAAVSPLFDVETNTLFDWVPIEKTMVALYGRPLAETKVNYLVSNWNPKALGVILLSWRHQEERYAILDGQHRTEAARRVGLETIPARIYIDLTYQEEADLYVRFATVNKQSAIDRYRARLEAGDPIVLDIQSVLNEFHLEVPAVPTGSKAANQVVCVYTLEKVYLQYGRENLRLAMHLLHAAWKGRQLGYGAAAVAGASAFWARYQGKASMAHAIDVLSRSTPEEVAILARKMEEVVGQMNTAYAWGRAILRLYNTRLKSPLSDWQDRLMPERPFPTRSDDAKRGWKTRRAGATEIVTPVEEKE